MSGINSGLSELENSCVGCVEKYTTRGRHEPRACVCVCVRGQLDLLGQLSLASLRGRLTEYQLRLGVRAGMSPLPGGR